MCGVFGRSKGATPQTAGPVPSQVKGGGKGRPTPKRRESERGRRRAVSAPKDRREAYRRAREEQRAQRTQMMHGLRAGDERHLPPRDRGPIRKYARDVVDSRRSVAEFFLPLALVILGFSIFGTSTIKLVGSALWLAVVVLIVVDTLVLAMRLRRGLSRAHPEAETRGVILYALMRSMQIRRFRLPPPRVKTARFGLRRR
ncbi:MAG: hypothetical protein QOH80_324 [Actinomycetota bacterium]|nr:hypothetical protein [Actinomycetota bacterium]